MLICGVDIGGTFTDLALFDADRGVVLAEKVLTTPADPSEAVARGLGRLAERLRGQAGASRRGQSPPVRFVHGTTLVTNALIEREGATTALITTEGFRDILDFQRENRYDIFDLALERPEPLVPLELRWEVGERVLADGTERRAPERAEVSLVAREIRDSLAEAVAIVFLHAYAHPAHEQQVRDWLTIELPDLPISISSEVAPQIREYERSCTTVINAFSMPLVMRYLERLSLQVHAVWPHAQLSMMVSNGGTCSIETARRFPVRLLESGPAAGVLAAQYYGNQLGQLDVLAFDMGGTTAKLSAIHDGQLRMVSQFEAAHVSRFKKGSGIPVAIPSLDLIEIGAGGGSIAEVDVLGLLQVGPRSAGSQPGPACYGLGGADATVTDANVVLGYLDPDYFLAGTMALDSAAASAAITTSVADPLKLPLLRAAWGVHDLVNENMAMAARLYLAGAGLDPRNFALVVTGGAGPSHAVHLAEKLEIKHVICPPSPGIGSAYGLLVAPPRVDVARSFVDRFDKVNWNELTRQLEELSGQAVAMLGDVQRPSIERFAAMAYSGQTHYIEVALPAGRLSEATANAIREAFDKRYGALYGGPIADGTHEIVSIRVTAQGRWSAVPTPAVASQTPVTIAASRPIVVGGGHSTVIAPVHRRDELEPGVTYSGPAVVVDPDASLVVSSGWEFSLDDFEVIHVVDKR